MSDIFFVLAAVLSLIWCAVHLFVGGKEVAAPLRRATELDPVVRDVQYLCWHFTTISIAIMALFFFLAFLWQQQAYAVAGTILALGFSIVGIGLVFALGQNHLKVPQGWLFVPIAALGIGGLIVS